MQGDPGDGKSSMMIHLIAELSKGGALPDGRAIGQPQKVIYQCAEDGAKDTIRLRMEAAGADCRNIAFLNESIHEGLTLDDERIRDFISGFRPQLVVIDPIQSYVENDSDLQIAVKARKLMRSSSLAGLSPRVFSFLPFYCLFWEVIQIFGRKLCLYIVCGSPRSNLI